MATIRFAIALLISLFGLNLVVACDTYYIESPDKGDKGDKGDPGENGKPCDISNNGDGTATITCPDGDSITVVVGSQPCDPVVIKDPVLEKCVLDVYDTDKNGFIDEIERKNVTEVVCGGLSDLSGIECFPKVEMIWLDGGSISDLTPLAHLSHLETLFLDRQKIQDLKPLMGLSKLGHLSLIDNPVRDLSPLQNLTHLYGLNLVGTNIGSLEGLPQSLTWLALSDTDVEDLTPLEDLKNLGVLYATGCLIADPTPLLALKLLHFLKLAQNPIDCEKYGTVIEQLRENIAEAYNDLDVVCPPQ